MMNEVNPLLHSHKPKPFEPKTQPPKPDPTTRQSESESGSESESEPGQSVKPITSKPMEETPPKEAAASVAKKFRSKPA
ncbi:hypothetical protein OIU84_009051 [Salix udensis]|uniref:Uncharacterized protein n=1 Tax=Salix udensis TaxID=889485 RepID=A0AAD6JQE7_9ROSI|nr:hypothetical protein OIU84_009051 [Salix udensis]